MQVLVAPLVLRYNDYGCKRDYFAENDSQL